MDSAVERRARYELAHFGEAIGDPSRAAMLVALIGGAARPASELARAAGVAPSTASSHLAHLLDAQLVVVRPQGRHRYYALASPEVAHAVESLVTLRAPPRRMHTDDVLANARTCYGHLAGRLAVAFWSRARDARWVRWTDGGIALLPRGRDAFLPHADLPLAGRPCIDWTERVPHVSGPLGVRVCEAFLAERWLARARGSRALRVTPRGEAALARLGVRV
jgi:DNA-binding transcriptional ArsR family regulator